MFWVFAGEIRAQFVRESSVSAFEKALYVVDGFSAAVGKTYGWCILVLTFTTSYEVFSRYVFLAPTEWAFDASYMLYGTLFMMAGAYALSRNSHVRGDFIYRAWSDRAAGDHGSRAVRSLLFPRACSPSSTRAMASPSCRAG